MTSTRQPWVGDGEVRAPAPTARSETHLRNKIVWVTGAGRGLGRAVAIGMARAGARVALTSRTENDLQEVASQIKRLGGESLVVPGSVAEIGRADAAVAEITDRLGPVDALVNMAGINPVVSPSVELTDRQWRRVIEVNLTGTFQCCRAVAIGMLDRGQGSIINVSSVHGSRGVPEMAAYAASKGGVETLTKALAVEWALSGVRVNCLAPGYFRTALTEPYLTGNQGRAVRERTPMGRIGDPDELIGATVFLASDASSYMTGATLTVDGGWTAQ